MVHHFLQRGIMPEKILNRPIAERLFFVASVRLEMEHEREKIKAMSGGE